MLRFLGICIAIFIIYSACVVSEAKEEASQDTKFATIILQQQPTKEDEFRIKELLQQVSLKTGLPIAAVVRNIEVAELLVKQEKCNGEVLIPEKVLRSYLTVDITLESFLIRVLEFVCARRNI